MSELGPNFKLGDQDRIVNSFNKNDEFKYAMVLVRDSSFNIYMAHNLSYMAPSWLEVISNQSQ